MFNREEERKFMKSFLKSATDEEIERFLDHKEYSERNLVNGDNVIHLRFTGRLVPEDEIPEFKKLIEKEGYQLGYQDTVVTASSGDTTNTIAFNAVIFSLATSALYDAVKTLTLWVWVKSKKGIPRTVEESNIKVYPTVTAMTIVIDDGKIISYLFPNKVPKKIVYRALDNLPQLVVKHQEMLKVLPRYNESFKLTAKSTWKHIPAFAALKLAQKEAKKQKNKTKNDGK